MTKENDVIGYMKACGYSVLSLSNALGENRQKVSKKLQLYEQCQLTDKYDYLKQVFDFLFLSSGTGLFPSIPEGKLRFLMLQEVLAKLERSEMEEKLFDAKGPLNAFHDFVEELNVPLSYYGSKEELSSDDYRSIVKGIIDADPNLRFPTTWFGSNVMGSHRYVLFTTNELHKRFNSRTEEKRTRWLSINDSLFFTICIDPHYQQKGIVCELWFFDTEEKWNEVSGAFNSLSRAFGQKDYLEKTERGEEKKKATLCRLFIKRFSLGEANLRKELESFLEKEIPEVSAKLLELTAH